MSTQLLFYRQVAPISADKHKDLSVKLDQDYSFAKEANAVPLTLGEIPSASSEYCVMFAGSDDDIMPVVILGVAKEENLYVDEQGKWDANYIPAFVRRYPFVFARSEDEKTFTLCVDEQFSGCNQEGRGERLFDTDGERTSYLEQVLQFQQEYQRQHLRTQAFCKQLVELDLLEPVQAQIKLASGDSRLLNGVRVVNRSKLKELDTEKLEAMLKSDALELIYLHLHSLQNLQKIGERLPASSEPETAPEAGNADESVAEEGEDDTYTTH